MQVNGVKTFNHTSSFRGLMVSNSKSGTVKDNREVKMINTESVTSAEGKWNGVEVTTSDGVNHLYYLNYKDFIKMFATAKKDGVAYEEDYKEKPQPEKNYESGDYYERA